jgi:iron complex outermembrane receptor protein
LEILFFFGRHILRIAKPFQRRFLAFAVAGGVFATMASAAERQAYHIAAGSLDQVLISISRQSGQVISFSPEISRYPAPAIDGKLSVEEAVRQALQGSGLELQVSPGGAFVVVRAEKASAAASPAAASTRTSVQAPALDTVVVSATRRAENLQDVPIAVSAFSGSDLAKAGINGISDLAQLTPGLNVGNRGTARTIFLRGVGSLGVSAGDEPSVATYIDGVYQSNPFTSAVKFNNVERVEVLKGPQGTLYGRNATGGLINIVTLDPRHDPSGSVELSYGNYDTRKVSAYGTAGLTDSLAADLAVYYEDQKEGYGENVFTGDDVRGTRDISLRSKWLYEPSDYTQVRFTANYSNVKSSTGMARAMQPGSIGADGVTSAPSDFYDINADIDADKRLESSSASLQIRHDFERLAFISTTAFGQYRQLDVADNDATPAPVLGQRVRYASSTYTQEFQLQSTGDGGLKWMVGAFFLEDQARSDPQGTGLYGLAFYPYTGVNYIGSLDTSSQALFGELVIPLGASTNLTLGGRLTHDKKTQDARTDFLDCPGGCEGREHVALSIPVDAEESWTEPTWRAIVDHRFNDLLMVYGSYSRGYKSGTFNTVQADGVSIDPETLDAYEVGLKADLFKQRLRLNLAAFRYDYKDIQLPVSRGSTQVTVNAASSTIKGVDLDGVWSVSKGFDVHFGAAWLDATFDKFTDAPCTSRDSSGATVGHTCDVSGRDLVQTPHSQFNLGLSYQLPTELGDFELTANYWRTGKFYLDVDNRLPQDAYGLLNAEMRWSPRGQDDLSLALFGENILDEEYTTLQYAQVGLGDSYAPGIPALFGVRLKQTF